MFCAIDIVITMIYVVITTTVVMSSLDSVRWINEFDRVRPRVHRDRLSDRASPRKDPSAYLGEAWQLKWTRDIDLATRWFKRWPQTNLGILPDKGCCPLDVDNPPNFERFQAETVPAPPTPTYITGGADPPGRKRLLFAHDERLEHAERKLAPGVQLRFCTSTSALMSVAPPSIHPVTRVQLEWITGLDELPLAPLPEAWLARVCSSERVQARPVAHWREVVAEKPEEGERHQTVMSLAGHLAAKGVDAVVATELLCAWAHWKCTIAGKRLVTNEEIAQAVIYAIKEEAKKRG